jgi:hypothetical protein
MSRTACLDGSKAYRVRSCHRLHLQFQALPALRHHRLSVQYVSDGIVCQMTVQARRRRPSRARVWRRRSPPCVASLEVSFPLGHDRSVVVHRAAEVATELGLDLAPELTAAFARVAASEDDRSVLASSIVPCTAATRSVASPRDLAPVASKRAKLGVAPIDVHGEEVLLLRPLRRHVHMGGNDDRAAPRMGIPPPSPDGRCTNAITSAPSRGNRAGSCATIDPALDDIAVVTKARTTLA